MKALSKSKAATIYEVARRAGVSIATVSRALRDSDLVTEATRARVRAAVEELDFTPEPAGPVAGRGAARRQRHRLPRPDRPVLRRGRPRLRGGRRRAGQQRADPGHARPARRRRAAVLELAGRVDGMVVMGSTVGDDVVARASPRPGCRVVLLARPPGRRRRHHPDAATSAARRGLSPSTCSPRLPARSPSSATRPSRPTWPAVTRASGRRCARAGLPVPGAPAALRLRRLLRRARPRRALLRRPPAGRRGLRQRRDRPSACTWPPRPSRPVACPTTWPSPAGTT